MKFKNTKTDNIISASQEFIDNLPDSSDYEEVVAFVPTFSENQEQKLEEARTKYNNIALEKANDLAEFEKESWEAQRQEWLRYQDDVSSNTPYCDTLATARGITKDELMTKIGIKILGFATIQGQLHAIEDEIKACITQAELDLIIID